MVADDFFPPYQEVMRPLPAEELRILSRQYSNERYPSVQTRFNYAWGLVKCKDKSDIRRGITLLQEVFKDTPERRRECLYYLSVAHLKLTEYGTARRYADTLLEYEPHNREVVALRQNIEDNLSREGMIGVAIIGGAFAIGAAVLSSVLRRKR